MDEEIPGVSRWWSSEELFWFYSQENLVQSTVKTDFIHSFVKANKSGLSFVIFETVNSKYIHICLHIKYYIPYLVCHNRNIQNTQYVIRIKMGKVVAMHASLLIVRCALPTGNPHSQCLIYQVSWSIYNNVSVVCAELQSKLWRCNCLGAGILLALIVG